MTKVCCRCKKEKDGSEFYKNRARHDGLDTCCSDCSRARAKERQQDPEFKDAERRRARARRQKLIDELGGKCVCCGETTYEFLHFDHIDGSGA